MQIARYRAIVSSKRQIGWWTGAMSKWSAIGDGSRSRGLRGSFATECHTGVQTSRLFQSVASSHCRRRNGPASIKARLDRGTLIAARLPVGTPRAQPGGAAEGIGMSTDQQLYSADRLIFMARMHQKAIDYYNFVLRELGPSDEERSRIVGYIFREEKALAEIGKLERSITRAARVDELPHDLGRSLVQLRSHDGPGFTPNRARRNANRAHNARPSCY
jgi:hypothetical protein